MCTAQEEKKMIVMGIDPDGRSVIRELSSILQKSRSNEQYFKGVRASINLPSGNLLVQLSTM
jgi:hypothetical protein